MSRLRRPDTKRVPASANHGPPTPRVDASNTASGWVLTVAVPCAVLAIATAAAFWPVLANGFLNWDDPDVLVANASLRRPAADLVAWAFSTTHMHHYQPLSWLALAWLSGAPPDPSRVHALSVALHALNAGLVFWLARVLVTPSERGPWAAWGALAATLLFAVHPLRVEPVAWASAFPYLLSYACLIPAVACWIRWARSGGAAMLMLASGLFLVSQLARVTAPLLPLVLVLLAWADDHVWARTRAGWIRGLLPFAAIAIPLAAVEASARDVEALTTVGLGARLSWALANPGIYLWHTLWPVALTPLDVLPRAAQPDWIGTALGLGGLAAAAAITWRLSSRRAAIAIWGSYLLLLLPVLGLTPSGLQLTADRYTYGPAIVLTLAAAAMLAAPAFRSWRPLALAAAGLAALALGTTSRGQARYWHDSTSLWSRAAALDPDNDVALYNLALALEDAGRPDDASTQYERLLTRVPDHDLGRQRLSRLRAARSFAAANAAATAGRLDEAITGFDETLRLDPERRDARANRGMALLSRGDVARAAADLESAVTGGDDDPAVAGALAFAWASSDRSADAVALLRRVRAQHPDDLGLANNLARLLLTAEPVSVRNPAEAYGLAAQITKTTGGRDPRLLDTLALAFAAMGQADDARQALTRAIGLARGAGDESLAAELSRRLAALPR